MKEDMEFMIGSNVPFCYYCCQAGLMQVLLREGTAAVSLAVMRFTSAITHVVLRLSYSEVVMFGA